jgi:hypothetical protein
LAAILIIIVSIVATAAHMILGQSRNLDDEIQFAANVVNALSLIYLCAIIASHEKQSNAKFGEAVRAEMPTVLLAVSTSLTYSVVTLINTLLPLEQALTRPAGP